MVNNDGLVDDQTWISYFLNLNDSTWNDCESVWNGSYREELSFRVVFALPNDSKRGFVSSNLSLMVVALSVDPLTAATYCSCW